MKQIKYVLAAGILLVFLGGGFYAASYFKKQVIKAEEARKSEEAVTQEIQELYNAGLNLYRTKDYKAALSKFQEAGKLSPGNEQIIDYIDMIAALIKMEEVFAKAPPKKEPSVKVPTREKLALKEQKEKELQEARMRELAQRREQELRQNPQEFYNAARKLYQAKDYEAALSKFRELQDVVPGYRKTAYFIKEIPQIIRRNEIAKNAQEAKERKKALGKKVNELQKTGLKLYRAREYEAALGKFREIQNIAPGNSKADHFIKKISATIRAGERAAKAKEERERKRAAEKKAGEFYKTAIALYRARNYETALSSFREITVNTPGYGKTAYYIKHISEIIERNEAAIKAQEAREAKAALTRKAKELYKSALKLYKAKDYNAALAKFREITVNTPGYGKTIYYIKNISEIREHNEAAKKAQEAREAKAALTLKAKELYESARELYWAGDYNAALAKFREVQGVAPGYRKTSEYLREMPGLIKRQEKAPKVRRDIKPCAVGTVRDFELEDKLAKRYDAAQKALGEFEIKRTDIEKRELLSRIILEIDKLLELAKEAEKKQNYEMAAEFCEKILVLTSEKKMRRIINDQKERWAQEARKAHRKKEARADSPAKTKRVAAGTKAVAQKEERDVEAAAEHEEVAAEAAVSPEPATPEPATPETEERYFTLDFSQRIAAGEYLMQQGEKLLEEKKFKEAYQAFSKAIEVMD